MYSKQGSRAAYGTVHGFLMERFGSVEPQYLPIGGENCIKFAWGTLNFPTGAPFSIGRGGYRR